MMLKLFTVRWVLVALALANLAACGSLPVTKYSIDSILQGRR
jgi:hypothetical protein